MGALPTRLLPCSRASTHVRRGFESRDLKSFVEVTSDRADVWRQGCVTLRLGPSPPNQSSRHPNTSFGSQNHILPVAVFITPRFVLNPARSACHPRALLLAAGRCHMATPSPPSPPAGPALLSGLLKDECSMEFEVLRPLSPQGDWMEY